MTKPKKTSPQAAAFQSQLSPYLRALREEREISGRVLAAKTGCSIGVIRNAESERLDSRDIKLKSLAAIYYRGLNLSAAEWVQILIRWAIDKNNRANLLGEEVDSGVDLGVDEAIAILRGSSKANKPVYNAVSRLTERDQEALAAALKKNPNALMSIIHSVLTAWEA